MTLEHLTRESIDFEIDGHSVVDIVNFNEILVLQCLRELLRSDETLCRCSLCVEDVYALTLNRLPPRYVQVFNVYKYATDNALSEVREQLRAAADKVKANPTHR